MISYLARATWLHRVPAGIKLIALAASSLALLPVQDWRLLLVALGCASAIYLSFGEAGRRRLVRLAKLWPMMALIAAFHLVAGSWSAALGNVARLWLMIALADLVTMTTTMQVMMDAIAPLVAPARHIGLPPRKISLAVALVIRFVPLLMEHWDARREAWRARGGRRASVRLVAPFVVGTLGSAERFAEALAARGFSSQFVHQQGARERGPE